MSFWERLIALLAGPPRPAPTPAPTPPAPAPTPVEVAELAARVNALRARAGRAPLVPDARLDGVAQGYAEALAEGGRLRHGDFAARIGTAFPGRACGECLARGQRTPADAARDLWGDPPHHAILAGRFTLIGCGVARDAAGTAFWCVDVVS